MTHLNVGRRSLLRILQVLCLLGCMSAQAWAGSRCVACDGCNGDFFCGLCIVEAVQRNCARWGPDAYATCDHGNWEIYCGTIHHND